MRRAFWAAYVLVVLAAGQAFTAEKKNDVSLRRNYREGEVVRYRMRASNQNGDRTTSYEARANGIVKRDLGGAFVEEFTWTGLSFNGHAVPSTSTGTQVQQKLSLDPRFKLSIPDLSKVQPAWIGPMTDLLTFYADVQLAMRQSGLRHAGDHVYIKRSQPNSWADHVHTLVGEDAIDFDITLARVNESDGKATVVVKHVPPAKPGVALATEWMRIPVADAANNWVQVVKEGGTYIASVGKETFTDRIELSLADGRILGAGMDNPVEVLERTCSDEGLQSCGAARRYRIRRQVEISSIQ